jgi:hypothetical protein
VALNERVNLKGVAIAGAVVVLAAAAVLNSQRAAHDRKQAEPAPTVSASPSPTAPAGFLCATFEALGQMAEASAPMRVAGHRDLVVTSVRCSDQHGQHASQVQIRDVADDGRILATLVRPQQLVHVASLSVVGGDVTVTGLELAPPNSGSVFATDYRFDGSTATASAPRLVAFGCAADDLRVQLAARVGSSNSNARPTSAVLQFHNVSAQTCAIEGYPGVTAVSSAGIRTPADEALFGPAGGVRRSGQPQVILLKPAGSASAIVDSAPETPSGDLAQCKTVSSLQIELPSGAPIANAQAPLQVCALQIHPLVLGLTGSDG